MKLHILSDLHNEFVPFDPPKVNADIVVLAGDIDVGINGLVWATKAFSGRDVIYLAGNHEYYGGHLSKVAISLRETAVAAPHLYYLDNDEVVIGGVRFLGSTLWTDFRLFGGNLVSIGRALSEASERLSDFNRNIRYGSTGFFTPSQSAQLHLTSVNWLERKLAESFDGPTVVVTHHCPGWGSVHGRFNDDLLTASFASDLDRLMGPPILLWVHGHTHNSFDYSVRGTRVICNPRGYSYIHENLSEHDGRRLAHCENMGFNPRLVVEV